MSRVDAKYGTFTALLLSGPLEVPITELVSVYGLDDLAAHRKIDEKSGFVANRFVISHIASGMRMPGSPGKTCAEALRRCVASMAAKRITKADLETRIADLSSLYRSEG